MFQWAKNLGAYGKALFERTLREPDVNSRLVFLGTFFITSTLMAGHFVVYAIGFLHGKPPDPAYPTILGVLGAGHGVNALGRFFTKKTPNGNGNGNNSAQPPDSDMTPTVVPSPSSLSSPLPLGLPTPGNPIPSGN